MPGKEERAATQGDLMRCAAKLNAMRLRAEKAEQLVRWRHFDDEQPEHAYDFIEVGGYASDRTLSPEEAWGTCVIRAEDAPDHSGDYWRPLAPNLPDETPLQRYTRLEGGSHGD